MDPELTAIFEVRRGRKRRQYRVSLLRDELELRPTDLSQGKIVALDLNRQETTT